MMRHKKRQIHPYTLTELLVVVALAAILLGISVPAFNVLTKGNSMTASVNDLAGKIKATRAYAITNNCYTALLFPAHTDTGTFPKANFLYRAYRPCVVYPRNNEEEWVFDSWIDGENWALLNKGVIFTYQYSALETFAFGAWSDVPTLDKLKDKNTTPAPETTSAKNMDITIPADQLDLGTGSGNYTFKRVMLFRPNGQLKCNTVVMLQEGIPATTAGAPLATQADPVYYALGINKYNGKITYYDPFSQ